MQTDKDEIQRLIAGVAKNSSMLLVDLVIDEEEFLLSVGEASYLITQMQNAISFINATKKENKND